MDPEVKDVLRVVSAYGEVLGRVALSVTYLLYLTASILSGWTAGLIFTVFGANMFSVALVVAVFASSFILAGMASNVIVRIGFAHSLALSGREDKDQTNYS